MSVRVTAVQVGQIIETSLSSTIVDVFIGVASRIVDEILGDDTTLSDDQKADVELFLSAHILACTRELQPISEATDEASIKYQGMVGTGLNSTFYGQQVTLIDTSGKMANYPGKKRAEMYSIISFETDTENL